MSNVTIIVPVFNQSDYLPICLDSILFQDYPYLEIIIVNDGSTDATSKVIGDYLEDVRIQNVSYASDFNSDTREVERCVQSRYPQSGRKIRVIHHDVNRGLGCALNTGFKAASGKYCTFIASDDMLLPNMISELVALLEQGFDFAYADMHIVDDRGCILRRFSLPDYSFEKAFCHWYLCGVCKLYRTDLHERVGYYREDIKPQDHEMFLRFAINGAKFVHLPKVLANVRIHDKERHLYNHSSANWDRLYRESAELVLKARRFFQRNTLPGASES